MSHKISEIYVFQGMDKEFIDKLIDNSRMVKYNSGDTIIKQGEESDYGYIIQDGEVEVERNSKKVNKIEAGNIFGEIALITNEPRTASIIASSDVKLLRINKDLLASVIQDLPNGNKIKETIRERIMMNMKK